MVKVIYTIHFPCNGHISVQLLLPWPACLRAAQDSSEALVKYLYGVVVHWFTNLVFFYNSDCKQGSLGTESIAVVHSMFTWWGNFIWFWTSLQPEWWKKWNCELRYHCVSHICLTQPALFVLWMISMNLKLKPRSKYYIEIESHIIALFSVL